MMLRLSSPSPIHRPHATARPKNPAQTQGLHSLTVFLLAFRAAESPIKTRMMRTTRGFLRVVIGPAACPAVIVPQVRPRQSLRRGSNSGSSRSAQFRFEHTAQWWRELPSRLMAVVRYRLGGQKWCVGPVDRDFVQHGVHGRMPSTSARFRTMSPSGQRLPYQLGLGYVGLALNSGRIPHPRDRPKGARSGL
jgi:hypothetical protein